MACTENYSPKPLGYFRIDLSEKTYSIFNSNCSFNFLRSSETKIIQDKNDCWYNIQYPRHNATIHLTYKTLNANLGDIIEEIVGDINDEFDDDDIIYSKLDNKNYVFEGKTTLKDFYRIINISGENFEQKKGEADSIAGFIIENTGSFPEKGQKINFENYTFSIESVNDRRIKRIKVTLPEIINQNE